MVELIIVDWLELKAGLMKGREHIPANYSKHHEQVCIMKHVILSGETCLLMHLLVQLFPTTISRRVLSWGFTTTMVLDWTLLLHLQGWMGKSQLTLLLTGKLLLLGWWMWSQWPPKPLSHLFRTTFQDGKVHEQMGYNPAEAFQTLLP